MNTKEIIERLLRVLHEKKPSEIHYLGKGLSLEEIESKIPIRPIPAGLIDIYSYISGSPEADIFGYIIGGSWNLIFIDEINAEIELCKSINRSMADMSPGYEINTLRDHMIPFLYDGGGNTMWVSNLPDEDSVWYFPKDDEPSLCYISINHFLLTVIACYERGAYFWNEEEGFWDNDYFFEIEIGDEIRDNLLESEGIFEKSYRKCDLP
jgi:hypothetical protein